MKIILLQDIRGIGRKFDVKDVADGYAQNFLLPRKLGERATPERVKEVEGKRATVLKEREMAESNLARGLEKLSSVALSIKAPANDQGHLFKKVKVEEIVAALEAQANIVIPPDSLVLEGPIKATGPHTIGVKIGELQGTFQLTVEKA